MRLVSFSNSLGGTLFLNPAHVVAVEPPSAGGQGAMITTHAIGHNGAAKSWTVTEDIDFVVLAINKNLD